MNLFLVSFFCLFTLDAASMFHAKPRFLVDIGMHIVFIVTELNIVPFRIVKRLGHGAFFTAAIVTMVAVEEWSVISF